MRIARLDNVFSDLVLNAHCTFGQCFLRSGHIKRASEG